MLLQKIPPGSGISDVPANVLILLDKSGSMGARMVVGFYNESSSTCLCTNGDEHGTISSGIKTYLRTNTADTSLLIMVPPAGV